MAFSVALIVCPIIFGMCFVSQTIYFIFKLTKSKETDHSGKTPVTTIRMSEGEATCCMGYLWTKCMDKTTNRMPLKTFAAWYFVAFIIDIMLTLGVFLMLYQVKYY